MSQSESELEEQLKTLLPFQYVRHPEYGRYSVSNPSWTYKPYIYGEERINKWRNGGTVKHRLLVATPIVPPYKSKVERKSSIRSASSIISFKESIESLDPANIKYPWSPSSPMSPSQDSMKSPDSLSSSSTNTPPTSPPASTKIPSLRLMIMRLMTIYFEDQSKLKPDCSSY